MITTQQRNGELAALLGADLAANVRNVGLGVYDSAGGAFTGLVTCSLGQTRVNLAPALFGWDGSVLTLSEGGVLQVSYAVAVESVGGSAPAEVSVWLEQDPATGVFAAVPGGLSYVAVPAVTGVAQTVGRTLVVRAATGYRFRLRAQRTAGSDTMYFRAGGNSLDVLRLYKAG